MNRKTAVLFFPDAISHHTDKPLMLAPMLFCPVLQWVGQSLSAQGVQRFFAVCDTHQQQILACLPQGAQALSFDDSPAVLSEALLDTEQVMVLQGPVIPAGFYGGNAVFLCTGAALSEQLSSNGSLDTLPQGAVSLPGFIPFGDLAELDALTLLCRDAIVKSHQQNGVRFLDPTTVYLDPRVQIGSGTLLLPGTILRGNTVIGQQCQIGPHTMLEDCTIGDGSSINASQGSGSIIGRSCTVGPFAYIRPGCTVADHVRVGDFVELKNSNIGEGTKISHLTYVGDADVGQRVNFGCGTVTTNYDGFHKHRTHIEDDCFIGCNTNLIAPVRAGQGSYIAAGSTVTEDVPAHALAVARARQSNQEGWAFRNRSRKGGQ